jgi:hypothetical protein
MKNNYLCNYHGTNICHGFKISKYFNNNISLLDILQSKDKIIEIITWKRRLI